MPRSPRLVPALALVAGALAAGALAACTPAPGPSESDLRAPPLNHGPPPSYAGTWIGPELSLHFAGPWVLVRPSDTPDAAPIEMRVLVERQEGEAYALRTTLAGVFPADFLRPSDWTLLVEDEQLAIAMGDEALTAYVRAPEPAPALIGPQMADADALPEHLTRADALTCLEAAADACAALEERGPLVAGCRELRWSSCLVELGPAPADPTAREAHASARALRIHAATLRFGLSLRRASDEAHSAAADAFYSRALSDAAALIESLRAADGLPDEPALVEVEAAIAAARAAP